MVKVGGYLDDPADLPYVTNGVQLEGRHIFLLPYFSTENKEWFGFFQRPDKPLQRVALVDVVSGAFLASAPLKADQDFYLPLEDLVFQRMSFPGIARPLSGLENVIKSFASLLELYEQVSHNCQEERTGALQTAQLLVNHLMVVTRTAFDVLQGISCGVCGIVKRTDDKTKPLMKQLGDSFAKVVLHADKPLPAEALMNKFNMPRPLADFYSSYAPLLVKVRSIRDDIVHRGYNAGFVFNLDQGLAVATKRRPWNQLQIWDERSLARKDLGSLRMLFAYIISEVIKATTRFGETFASCILLPEPLSPGNHVFLRGPLNHHLLGLEQTLASPWERQSNQQHESIARHN